MLFNSLHFLIYFPIVILIYFLLQHRFRWMWLLAASCYFYTVFIPQYIFILFALILIDYSMAIAIENARGNKRRFLLGVSIFATCAVLFIFKYYNLFYKGAGVLTGLMHFDHSLPNWKFIMPVGLSFHTFQSLSYVIEVYRGNFKAQRHLGIYSLYVMFFPQLVAGPIERPQNLLPQILQPQHFDYKRVTDGLKLMAWGFFKKLVIADRLGSYVNIVYGDSAHHQGIPILLATYFFAFQIYCDFSGYSDIAIGSARVMGFRLMENFKQPYFAASIPEFWRRWHISLSTWFRDYLYFPLGGNRVGRRRLFLNIMIVFVISGLWHGAHLTFMVWGAVHGIYYLVSQWTKNARERIYKQLNLDPDSIFIKCFRIFITFHLVCFAWIIFRADSMSHVAELIRNMCVIDLSNPGINSPLSWFELKVAVLAILLMETVHVIQRRTSVREYLAHKPLWMRWAVYYVLIFSILVFGQFNDIGFIYFQF